LNLNLFQIITIWKIHWAWQHQKNPTCISKYIPFITLSYFQIFCLPYTSMETFKL